MTVDKTFNAFSDNKFWSDKVYEGDLIWAQLKTLLENNNAAPLPQTPRRPDVRLIINNISGEEAQFLNPGDHSAGKQEKIPGTGDKCAVMVMVKGLTLEEQYANAQALYSRYDLDTKGLSAEFVADLKKGVISAFVAEAYGPAPFGSQSDKLVNVEWKTQDDTLTYILPVKGEAASYGARAATMETVFRAQFDIYVKGTGTTPEAVESDGICIAVGKNDAGADTTRPIAPSVAKIYYGEHYNTMPVARVHVDGTVTMAELQNKKLVAARPAKKPVAKDHDRPSAPPKM